MVFISLLILRFVMEYEKSIYEIFEKSCKLVNIAKAEMVSPNKCHFTNIQPRDRNSIIYKHIALDVELDPMSTPEEIVLKVKIVPNNLLFVGEIDDPNDENLDWLRDAYEYIAKNLVTDYFSITREFYWCDDEFIIHVATDIAHYVYDTAAEINKVVDYSLDYNILNNIYGK